MNFIIKTTPEEVMRARKWWEDLEMQWKLAYNQAVFGVGPTVEPPKEDMLMMLLTQIDTLRFAGPLALNPNMSTVLTNLSGLIPLYKLRYLSLTNMEVESLQPLVNFTQLEHLFVNNNRIKSLQGIENLTKLVDLYVQQNQIKDLKPIEKLTNLHTIYALGNQLEKIDGLNENHVAKLRQFYILPNDNLPDKEILRVQNEIGIICRKG